MNAAEGRTVSARNDKEKAVERALRSLIALSSLDDELLARGIDTFAERTEMPGEVRERRAELTRVLTPETLRLYDVAARTGRQPAVLGTKGSVCCGCHLRLPTKIAHDFQAKRRITACPHCHRLLYNPEWLKDA